ncbi:MAG: DNA polymerase Y family protein, partial [Rhodomicrobium sp.]|nr:DNA polymerase Y family protein [Rhodomicrobium sp.]
LIVADAEPEACEKALTALAAWAQRYSPATAPAPPSGLWLDITGCAHLRGGEAELAEDLLSRLEARGIPARVAIAPAFGAAYALAHHARHYVIAAPSQGIGVTPESAKALIRGLSEDSDSVSGKIPDRAQRAPFRDDVIEKLQALLAPLPVERLRIGNETASVLRKLGLFTIGDVQKLPRASLSRRFPDLLLQLDKAMGHVQEAIEFLRSPVPWIERLRFAEPVSAPEDLERATLKLLEILCARLQAERQGGLKFEVSFFRSDGGVQTETVSTALPTRDPARIMRLFREKLGFIDPGFGVDLAMLAAPHTEPLDELQSSILGGDKNAANVEDLAALIDALENRLGKGRVYRLAPQESYIPESAVKRQAVIPETPKALSGILKNTKHRVRKDPGYRQAGSGTTLQAWQSIGERPIRLFARPQPIDVTAALPDAPPVLFRWRKVLHRVTRAEGPERISPEWWRGGYADEESQVRDYYRVESTQGLRFWVFREGVYGGDRLPRWYLHGLFP